MTEIVEKTAVEPSPRSTELATPSPANAAATARFAHGNESYRALVWRRFRKSVPGMIGFVMVAMLLIVALFADFFAPVNPHESGTAFAPPDRIT